MHRFLFLLFTIFAAAAQAATGDGANGTDGSNGTDKTNAAGLEFFEKNIRPVLAEKCYKCHSASAEKVKGGLQLDTREGIREGGDNGPAVAPGDPEGSLLLTAIRYTDKDMQMPPPKSGGKLPDATIKNFEAWVKMGAPDPRDGTPAPTVAKRKIDPAQAKEFWAFQLPKTAPAPAVQDTAWPRTDVDRFILAGLEAQKLHPVADAEPGVLVRRLYFDLVGLPPSPEEVEAFVKAAGENRAAATEAVVDKLLASPQFGERWGRHWLDVARYAESTGKERNFTFPEAWRYRDYVIAAFNAGQPYDEFIREQIAGDLLPAKDDAERNRHVIATGLLALGPKGLNEKKPEQFRMDVIDEQIDTMSRAVLGLTVACARCHDHKFDPVPQREYYALAGIFHSSTTHFGTPANAKNNRNATPLIPLAGPAPVVAEAKPAVAPPANDNATLPPEIANNPAKAKKFAALPPARKAKVLARLKAAAPKEPVPAAPAQPESKPENTAGNAMGVSDSRPGDIRLLVRGELDAPGESVPRGFVNVLTNGPVPAIAKSASGRRELADWLTAPTNPLTARVMVNRVWSSLFGQGLVRTPDNFGTTGEKPSHPELLDTLAVQFVQNGWSVKQLIRSLVLSRTYQLSSAHDSAANEADPDNRLLWRASPRRLDAEAIRDAILTVSGTLDLTPAQGSFVATVGDGYVGRGVKPEAFTNYQSNKRSIYLPIVRDFVPEVLDAFDFAEPSLVVAARDVTNVPSQALFLMNNSFVREQAAACAKRILATPLDYPQRIRLAYTLTLNRPPTDAEVARANQYLVGEARALIPVKNGSREVASETSWATFCQALFACAEFRYLR